MRPAVSRVDANSRSSKQRAQAGAIALMTAILLPVLFGFGAFVIDLARLYIYKTEIQNAMDGCALGASLALTGTNDPKIFDQARAYGKVLTDPTASPDGVARPDISVNRVHFQAETFDQDQVVVEFSTALSGAPWVAATGTSGGLDPAAAKFARCSYLDEDNPLFFMPLLRAFVPGAADKLTVAASAAASLRPAQTACAFPVAMCAAPGSSAGTDWGLIKGQRYSSVTSPGAALSTGNFGWLDFSPPAGGTPELAALIAGSGSCAVGLGDPVGQEGYAATLRDAWNTRFGVYKGGGGAGAYSKTTAPPDLTGFSFPPPGGPATVENNYPNYNAALALRSSFQGKLPGTFSNTTVPDHGAFGQKRRIVTAAIVDCAGFAGSGKPPVLDFACILLLSPARSSGAAKSWSEVSDTLDVEYIGRASVAGMPCASVGLAGGTFGPPIPALVQ